MTAIASGAQAAQAASISAGTGPQRGIDLLVQALDAGLSRSTLARTIPAA